MKYKIEKIITKCDKVKLPILAEFQNGSFSPEEAKETECYTEEIKGDKKRKAVAFNGNNVYHSIINENYQSNLINTYIAVANKHTKKIRIIQVDQCSMINDIYELPKEEVEVSKQKDREESKKILLTEFSGKKAKSYYDKHLKTKTNIDVLQNQLDSSIVDSLNNQENEDSFTKAKVAQELKVDSMFPPVNLDAKTLDKVYNICDLIPSNILENLTEEAINILKNEGSLVIEADYLKLVICKIQDSKDPDSPDNLNKVKICIYLDALIRLLNIATYRVIQNVSQNTLVFKDIQERFSSEARARMKTMFTHRKAVCYFLVLSMMISDNFEIAVEPILGLFKTSRNEIQNYAMSIGGYYKSASDTITLKLPKGKPFRNLKATGKYKK